MNNQQLAINSELFNQVISKNSCKCFNIKLDLTYDLEVVLAKLIIEIEVSQ